MSRLDFSDQPIPCVGYNPSGLPLLEDGTVQIDGLFFTIPVDEDLDNILGHDPLIPVDDLLVRPMYYDQELIDHPRQFVRRPALQQLMAYDALLQNNLGWRLRLTDAYRGVRIQQTGYTMGVAQCLERDGYHLDDLRQSVRRIFGGESTTEDITFAHMYFTEGARIWSYVPLLPFDRSLYPATLPELVIVGSANIGELDLPLNRFGRTPHSTGGVVDIEWVDTSGKLVNVGVPVDLEGIESALPFFEDAVPTCIATELQEKNLTHMEDRQKYYQHMITIKPPLRNYLAACGVDVNTLTTSHTYLQEVWREIQSHRRIVYHAAENLGIKFYGIECWHVDCNDARGGVRSARTGTVSGAPGYAVQMGQTACAWGNATALYDRMGAADKK